MLGHKIFKPARVVLPMVDPAVDIDQSDVTKYMETFDESHLKFDGEPSRFTIRQLTEVQKDFLEGLSNTRIRAKQTVAFSLQAVTDYLVVDDGGNQVAPPMERRDAHGKLGSMLTDDSMDALGFSTEVLAALHVMIMAFSEAKPGPLVSSPNPSTDGQ